ncbi:MAG: hypothetical protein ACI4VF_01815 [Lachnospirales bacterium]
MSCYIIKDREKISAIFFKDCEIYKQEFKGGLWGGQFLICENAREDFSIAYGKEDIILYQLISGDIAMARKGGTPKIILKNMAHTSPNIVINSIFNNNLRLIYNIVDKNRERKLVTQTQRHDKEWNKPEIIDSFVPINSIAKIVELNENLHILIYCKKMPEFQFGYREISEFKISEFKMIYATGYNILDYSFCITKDALHFVFIQSTGFMQRLIYVKKDGKGISKPVSVYDGLNIKKCLIGIINNRLCVWWIANRSLSIRTSFNFGESFNKPEIVRGVNTENISKAVFIDKTDKNPDKYIFNEIYVDTDRPINIYFLDDIKEKKINKDREIEMLREEIEKIKRIIGESDES